MLGFISEDSEKIGKKIDLAKLKVEINSLAAELRFLKERYRNPDLNLAMYKWLNKGGKANDQTREFSAVCLKRYKSRLRFNKLVVLRSLMGNKIHFDKNTRFEEIDYGLVRLGRFPTKDDLWAWVEDVRKEFEV